MTDAHEAAVRSGASWRRAALVGGLIVVATLLHYGVDPRAGEVHDVLTRSYYIPIVLAGLWLGAVGGFLSALAVTAVFLPHALHGWNAPYGFGFLLIEILMYHVIGILTGAMSSRTRRALAAEREARLAREKALADEEATSAALRTKTREALALEEQVRRADRLAALGTLSAGLAHEIRNPLASIKTAAEILTDRAARGRPSPESAELSGVIVEETQRLDRTLTAFLDFARSERDLEEDEPRRAHLGRVVQHTSGLLAGPLEKRDVSLSWAAAPLDLEVAVADSHVKQVVLNLLLNAAEAVDDGGRIAVELVERTPTAVTFAVEDDGPGFPPELGDTVFDPFVSTRPGGTGLGLSVVARLVDSYGGRIEIDRTAAAGARVLVTVPLP